MSFTELNERMAEGLAGKAEHVGADKGAPWRTVFMVFWEFAKMLAGQSSPEAHDPE